MTFHDHFKLCLFQFSITFSIAFKFKTFLNYRQGFRSVVEKKSNFPGFSETELQKNWLISQQFCRNFEGSFPQKKRLVKNGRFREN